MQQFSNPIEYNLFFIILIVNVDIPMHNHIMEQNVFGQMASCKWAIATIQKEIETFFAFDIQNWQIDHF